jgi:hypothetical protein
MLCLSESMCTMIYSAHSRECLASFFAAFASIPVSCVFHLLCLMLNSSRHAACRLWGPQRAESPGATGRPPHTRTRSTPGRQGDR